MLRKTLESLGLSEQQVSAILAAFPAPDATRRNTEREYLNDLLERSRLSKRALSRLLDVRQSVLRDYLSGRVPCPYPVQYCLEILAELDIAEKDHFSQSEVDDDR